MKKRSKRERINNSINIYDFIKEGSIKNTVFRGATLEEEDDEEVVDIEKLLIDFDKKLLEEVEEEERWREESSITGLNAIQISEDDYEEDNDVTARKSSEASEEKELYAFQISESADKEEKDELTKWFSMPEKERIDTIQISEDDYEEDNDEIARKSCEASKEKKPDTFQIQENIEELSTIEYENEEEEVAGWFKKENKIKNNSNNECRKLKVVVNLKRTSTFVLEDGKVKIERKFRDRRGRIRTGQRKSDYARAEFEKEKIRILNRYKNEVKGIYRLSKNNRNEIKKLIRENIDISAYKALVDYDRKNNFLELDRSKEFIEIMIKPYGRKRKETKKQYEKRVAKKRKKQLEEIGIEIEYNFSKKLFFSKINLFERINMFRNAWKAKKNYNAKIKGTLLLRNEKKKENTFGKKMKKAAFATTVLGMGMALTSSSNELQNEAIDSPKTQYESSNDANLKRDDSKDIKPRNEARNAFIQKINSSVDSFDKRVELNVDEIISKQQDNRQMKDDKAINNVGQEQFEIYDDI